jgi:hypothetical protein
MKRGVVVLQPEKDQRMGNALLKLLFQPPETQHLTNRLKNGSKILTSKGNLISVNFLDRG